MSKHEDTKKEEIGPFNGDWPEHAQKFVNLIVHELEDGYGLVPFIGAGFSAPSGAPLIYEIEDYLQRCICISLGIDQERIFEEAIEPWNPRTDQWPPFIDRSRMYDRGHWVDLLFSDIQQIRERGWDQSGTELTWADTQIRHEAFGAMQDWRTALLFLSRLNRGRRGSADAATTRLGAPQQEVVDACFREVLKGKYPTLGHRMLAALAGALRLDVLLTTNFDNLLERAFETARNPLEVFEVPIDGKLPDWTTVSSVRALVKLHGGRSSLRADYSLDVSPSEEDKQTFLHYLLSAQGRQNFDGGTSTEKGLDFQNHLLVIGFSATDLRISSFIEYAFRQLNADFRVYWICHTDKDVDRIRGFADSLDRGTGRFNRIVIIRHTQAGLLLLQLYQLLRRTLPPLGSIFPSVSRLTFPPLEPEWIREELKLRAARVGIYINKLKRTVSDFEKDHGIKNKVILATSPPKVSGLTSASARAFQAMEQEGKVCLWIDLNDITSADSLFEVLLEAIYYRLGFEDWIPSMVGEPSGVNASSRGDRRQKEIDRLIRSVNKRWVVFLNAYETPGANTSDDQKPDGNGWFDDYDGDPNASELNDSSGVKTPESKVVSQYSDHSVCAKSLVELLKALSGVQSRMSIILMTRKRDFFDQGDNTSRIEATLVELQEQTYPIETFFQEREIAFKALRWAGHDPKKRRFLHALVLMQRPRHMATLWSPALPFDLDALERPDKDIVIASDHHPSESATPPLQWVDELESEGLIRRKYGGLIWLHSPCRQMLRQLIDVSKQPLPSSGSAADGRLRRNKAQEVVPAPPDDIREIIKDWPDAAKEALIHRDIAQWYERVLDASASPGAAFEAAYHYCRASLAFLSSEEPEYGRAEAHVEAASALLKTNSFLIQTHGYSRGSCRRLEDIAKSGTTISAKIIDLKRNLRYDDPQRADATKQDAVTQAIRKLWIACAEIMRAIAREVGEDAKAYYRQRQVGRLVSGEADWSDVQVDDTRIEITRQFREALKKRRSQDSGQAQAQGTDQPDSPNSEWLRWRRWSGMLAIASRSYQQARYIFEKELGSFNQHDYVHKPLTTQSQRIELLRMIEQSVELMLLEVRVILRAKGQQSPELQKTASLLSDADVMIQRGSKLVRRVRSADSSADARDVIIANWCEARMLMHQSVIEGYNRSLGLNRPSVLDAMGILSDAEANLRVSDMQRFSSELAMIDMHRADVKLYDAQSISLSFQGRKKVTLSTLVPMLEGLGDKDALLEAAIRKHKLPENVAQLRQTSALVADGIRFLNRAEPVLRDRRRNVWWTTWFFERKLRAIALSVSVSIFDDGTPIPFFGLEAAMRATETEADRLLADTLRMVRVDAYRVASVIDAYMSCMKALNMRLKLDGLKNEPKTTALKGKPEPPALPRRRAQMLFNLRDACSALEEVYERRTVSHAYKEGSEQDERVIEYYENVRNEADAFLLEKGNQRLLQVLEVRTVISVLSRLIMQREKVPLEEAITRAENNPKREIKRCKSDSSQMCALTRLTEEQFSVIWKVIENHDFDFREWHWDPQS